MIRLADFGEAQVFHALGWRVYGLIGPLAAAHHYWPYEHLTSHLFSNTDKDMYQWYLGSKK